MWEDVNHNVNHDMGKGIAAYQAHMPENSSVFGTQKEKYEKLAELSASGTINMADATYPNPMQEQKQETVVEQIQGKEALSPESRANELAVVANTTSVEDYKQVEEAGFSVIESDSHTIVTVTDKIKAVLAEAGVDISIYGDGLTREQLEQITGNPAVTNQIMQALEANDLPVTEANMEDSVAALKQAADVSSVSEDAMAYLLKNELEPTIRNVYTAEHTGVTQTAEEWEASLSGTKDNYAKLEPQIAAIIEEAGLEVNEETMADGKWLLSHQIPLTGENLVYLGQLKELSSQLEENTYDWNTLVDSMAKAITDGKRPEDGFMITARRKLEETRLAMTLEAGRIMEKLGIQADTEELKALVEDLKEQEKQYYRELLTGGGVDATDENVDTFARTMDVFADLKTAPAYVIGQADTSSTVEEIHDAGETLRSDFARANERYEPLMTAPRSDMGDSIQKAFGNVDDILKDLNLETSESNRRAVRILAYNEMPITEENISSVKALDESMQRSFRNMTPAVTLEMIRRGENPLDMTLEELNHTAEMIRQETGNEEEERFSKYLYKLEQNQQISEEERSSYIGIYRLIAQVEKTDGAAIGALMNQGRDITMRNLLTAMRSTRKSGMDYSVDDEFDGVEKTAKGPRIDEQIQAGFQQNCIKDILDHISPEKLNRLGSENWEDMTPEQLAEALEQMDTEAQESAVEDRYIQEQMAEYRQVLDSSGDIYAYLQRYDMVNSMANVLVVSDLLRRPNQMMDRLWKQGAPSLEASDMLEALKQQVLEKFGESLENPEELADAQETLADVAEHVMDTMIIEDPDVRSLDVRELRQMTSQFRLCAEKAKEESYMVPIQTGDSVTGVSLKIVRGKKEKGLVDVLFDSPKVGKVAASFQAKDQGIVGMIAVDKEAGKQLLEENLDLFTSALKSGSGEQEIVDIHITMASDLSLEHYEMAGLRREERLAEKGELAEDRSNTVQTTRLYHIAEGFIKSIQTLLN